MSAPVTLTLGSVTSSPSLPHAVAVQAQEQGHIVVIATDHPDPSCDYMPLDLHGHDSFTSTFDFALATHGRIDNVILVFTPPKVTRPEGYIPGTDQSSIDDVILPLMRALKIAFYHFRRATASPVKPKMAIFAAKGHDAETRTSFNAVLGLYRSVVPRAKSVGISLDLVVGDASRAESIGAITSALLAPASQKPSVHIIDAKGKTTTQAHTVGQCWSSAILVLHGRFVPLVWLKEKVTVLQIQMKPFLHPTKSSPVTTQLAALLIQVAQVAFLTFAAIKGYYLNGPILAFVLAFVASRFASFSISALLLFVASRAALRGDV